MSAGEDMFTDPVGTVAVRVIFAIRNGDDLDHGASAGQQGFVTGGKKWSQAGMTDSLEHLDGNDFRILPFDMPVIAELKLNAILKARIQNALAGKLELLSGYGNPGHPAAGLLHGFDGKASPATADFEDMVSQR